MPQDFCNDLLRDFLTNSWSSIIALVENLSFFEKQKCNRHIAFFRYVDGQRINVTFNGAHFFLRGSVEYSNPQLTVEELQGIIAVRMLATCANYFNNEGLHEPNEGDIRQLCELLKKPPEGIIMPFLLNTDDVEPDRYSMNPLKNSLVASGQSAFSAACVKTGQLKIDGDFVKKYEGKLISRKEVDKINGLLEGSSDSYLDLVDSLKYSQIQEMSDFFGVNLSLYALRMPITTLKAESKEGLLHYIISESHCNYETVSDAYSCMGRSMSNRTTLLTVPHSKKGYGSKRVARGKLHFKDKRLQDVTVKYKTTLLYPNGVDSTDIAVAEADDNFTVSAEKLADYSYAETPSSPQFFLYSLGSPEDAALWHGVGVFASPQLLSSYSSARHACQEGRLIKKLNEKYGVKLAVPLQFNLAPKGMWRHPVYNNIDASVGSVGNLEDLSRMGMQVEYLSSYK